MRRYLINGYPVVLLVNGGNHYQMVTGYCAPDEYYVVDYAYRWNGTSWSRVDWYDPRDPNLLRGEWKKATELDFYVLDDLPSWALGFQGYKSATAIGVNGADIPF